MPVFTPGVRQALALATLLPTAGCCTIARLFCGPDKSPWVAPDYRTPDAALATFLEAIRRDRPDVISEAMSEAWKQRHGIAGVFETTVAWERLKRQVTGLHLAGNAEISSPAPETDRRVRYELSVAGRTLTVRLVEQAFWELCYSLKRDDQLERAGRFVDTKTLARMLVVQQIEDPGMAITIRDALFPELTPLQVREVRVGYAWKVDEIEGLTDS